MSALQDIYPDYPTFKGLQRPFEMLGFQGRYIIWAVATAGIGFIVFIACFVLSGFVLALISAVIIFGAGGTYIIVRQKKGLHSKKTPKGVFVYKSSRSL